MSRSRRPPLYSYPKQYRAYRFLGYATDDLHGLGAIASRRARRQSLPPEDGEEPQDMPVATCSLEPVPEPHRNCDLPRCPVCHWTEKGWGTQTEAIESWRDAAHKGSK